MKLEVESKKPAVFVYIKENPAFVKENTAGTDKHIKFKPFKKKIKVYETNPAEVVKVVENALFAACFSDNKNTPVKK